MLISPLTHGTGELGGCSRIKSRVNGTEGGVWLELTLEALLYVRWSLSSFGFTGVEKIVSASNQSDGDVEFYSLPRTHRCHQHHFQGEDSRFSDQSYYAILRCRAVGLPATQLFHTYSKPIQLRPGQLHRGEPVSIVVVVPSLLLLLPCLDGPGAASWFLFEPKARSDSSCGSPSLSPGTPSTSAPPAAPAPPTA